MKACYVNELAEGAKVDAIFAVASQGDSRDENLGGLPRARASGSDGPDTRGVLPAFP